MKLGFLEKPILDLIEQKKSKDEIYSKFRVLVRTFVLMKKPYLSYTETAEFIEYFSSSAFVKLFCSDYKFDFKYITLWLKKVYPGFLRTYLSELSTESAFYDKASQEALNLETENVLISEYSSQRDLLSTITCSMYIDNLCETVQSHICKMIRSKRAEIKNNAYLSVLLSIYKNREVVVGIDEGNRANVEFSTKSILNKLREEVSDVHNGFEMSYEDFIECTKFELSGDYGDDE